MFFLGSQYAANFCLRGVIFFRSAGSENLNVSQMLPASGPIRCRNVAAWTASSFSSMPNAVRKRSNPADLDRQFSARLPMRQSGSGLRRSDITAMAQNFGHF